jgi:GTP cyclohydrolase I
VIDTDSDHNTQETAKRVAKMYVQRGVRAAATSPCPSVTEFPNAERLNELMIVGPDHRAQRLHATTCARSWARSWIGLLPNEHSNLIGLSKYARLADWIMSRPQIQEEAVTMLANELQERGAARRPGHRDGGRPLLHALARREGHRQRKMINSVMRGAFLKDANLRREFLSLLSSTEGLNAMLVRLHLRQPRCGRRRRPGRADCHPAPEQAPTTRSHGVTGVLCYADGIFLQVLEGGRGAVNALYNRIVARPAPPRRGRCCSTRRSASGASPAGPWGR